MDKENILSQLKVATGNKSLQLPEDMDFASIDEVLTITLSSKSLLDNMQKSSAFEGWAICIKAICPNLAKKVIISWTGTDVQDRDTNTNYTCFLYRLIKFIENYTWASIKPLDSTAQEDYNKIKSQIHYWVITYPSKEVIEDVTSGEANLERKINLSLPGIHGQQLPTGLFFKKKCVINQRTPSGRSAIDLWSLENGTFTIYELKINDNKNVSIITQLMFYVNVVKDLIDGIIKYPDEAANAPRNVSAIYFAIKNKEISNILGVFLSDNIHTLIQTKQEKLLELLNTNQRNLKYTCMSSTSFSN